MRYCTKCGREMSDNDSYCRYCGAPAVMAANDLTPSSFNANNNTNTTNGNVLEKNNFAVAGFVLSFLIPVLGYVFGGLGLAKAIKSTNKKGFGLSIAALIISTVTLIISVIYYLKNPSGITFS